MQTESPLPHARPILRMSKEIDASCAPLDLRWKVRTYAGQRDLDAWLQIMNLSFPRPASTRAWDASDARRECGERCERETPAHRIAIRKCQLRIPASGSAGTLRNGSHDATANTGAHECWLAETNDSAFVVGMMVLCGTAHSQPDFELSLRWLGVLPLYRRRGVATTLVGQAERRAKELRAARIGAETLASWPGAVAFYHRHGFREQVE